MAARGLPSMATRSPRRARSPHPSREGGREQRRVDAVHQHGQPARRNPMMIGQQATQKRRCVSPRRRSLRNRRNRQSCRTRPAAAPPASGENPPLARVLDDRKMLQQRPKTRLLGHKGNVVLMAVAPDHCHTTESDTRKPKTAVNPSSEPCRAVQCRPTPAWLPQIRRRTKPRPLCASCQNRTARREAIRR